MSPQDISWIQRFNHYLKALSQLREAVYLSQERPLSKLEEQGLIQAFEPLPTKPHALRGVFVDGSLC